MPSLFEILGLIALLVVAQYVVGPILVRFQVRFAASPDTSLIEGHALPDAPRAWFAERQPAFEAAGFRPVGLLRIEDYAPNQTWYCQAYVNPVTGDGGSANHVTNVLAGGGSVVENPDCFMTVLANGALIGTLNHHAPAPFPRESEQLKERTAPGVLDLVTLYRIHRAHTASLAGNAIRKPLDTHSIERTFLESIRRQMQDRVELGYLYRDDLSGHFRPTWYGAVIMTWCMCWPVKSIRATFAKRWAARMLTAAPPMSNAQKPEPAREAVGAK